MKVVLSWLREFAPTDLGANELAELITQRGVKVEEVLRPWDGLSGVVVARVLEVTDHPHSDKLCVARVDDGTGEQVVCAGVRNFRAGDLVPWAKPGARVPVLDAPLAPRPLRGVVSNGMLCSPQELRIADVHTGILTLDETLFHVGDDIKDALGLDDAVLDIEVEPNRPDFLSVFGVAREVAAATGVPLRDPDVGLEESEEDAASAAWVRLDAPAGCPDYLARVIRGVDATGASPLWVQARLTASGMRPVSNVVDATNYVMLELGQPLHGFDMQRLAGPGIVVRYAEEGERLTTLDDAERSLHVRGPVDLRRRQARGDRRRDGRRDLGGVRGNDGHLLGERVLHPDRRPAYRTPARAAHGGVPSVRAGYGSRGPRSRGRARRETDRRVGRRPGAAGRHARR